MGIVLIVIGVAVNVWSVGRLLSPDGIIESNSLKIRIFGLELFTIILGGGVIKHRHTKQAIRLKNMALISTGNLLIVMGIFVNEWLLGVYSQREHRIVWIFNILGVFIGILTLKWQDKFIQYLNRDTIIGRFIEIVLALFCVAFIAVVFVVSISSIFFPYELEWVESACLNMVERIYNGASLYTKPSLNYAPLIYTPLYFYIGGYIAKLFDLARSLPLLRLTSFIFFILTIISMMVFIIKETDNWKAALIGIGVYSACFELSGAWYHIARVDSMFVFFWFIGILVLFKSVTHWHLMLSVMFLFFSYLTKQTAILYLPFLVLYIAIFKRRFCVHFIGMIGILIGGTTLILNNYTHGWYVFYIFKFQVQRGFKITNVLNYLDRFLLSMMIFAVMFVLLLFIIIYHRKKIKLHRYLVFYPYIGFVSFVITATAITQPGGYDNNMMPTYLWIALLLSIFFNFFQKAKLYSAKIMYNFILCLLFITVIYNPLKYIPRQDDYIAGKHIEDTISKIPGEVWIPHTTSYYFLTQKTIYAHQATLWDIQQSDMTQYKTLLDEQINQAIKQKKFNAVILEKMDGDIQKLLIEQGYHAKHLFPESNNSLYTKTGSKQRPEVIFYR